MTTTPKSRSVVGEARRSQLVGTFGVGSMFPAPDQSLMICGLDHWFVDRCPEIQEPRLAQSLQVHTLRAPSAGRNSGDVPVIRFPRFYFCPECRRLDHYRAFQDPNLKSPYCSDCGIQAVPSRFVIACVKGHIADFPYRLWAHSEQKTRDCPKPRLQLVTRGQTSSLADVVVKCQCGASRSMSDSFSPASLKPLMSCGGERPWLLSSPDQDCSETPRTMQRGSSSTWFGNVASAISIPPWSELNDFLSKSWAMLKDQPDEMLRPMLSYTKLPGTWGVEEVIQVIHDRREGKPLTQGRLREQEYEALLAGREETHPNNQFVCTRVEMEDPDVGAYVSEVRDVSRLREVRALVSFSRLSPVALGDPAEARLSAHETGWLPAIEVFGEGIFLTLEEDRILDWAARDFATSRARVISVGAKSGSATQATTPRQLLLHSFAHAVMNELSMEAGYPVSSLRERIYAEKGEAGVLIYTATADSAGSLGGLSAQAETHRLAHVIRSAMQRALWCTSDPVCMESRGSGIDNLNLAACHACMLVPETSCEYRNTFLDRALLIGTHDDPGAGFFSRLVSR